MAMKWLTQRRRDAEEKNKVDGLILNLCVPAPLREIICLDGTKLVAAEGRAGFFVANFSVPRLDGRLTECPKVRANSLGKDASRFARMNARTESC